MSHAYYDSLWREAMEELSALITNVENPKPQLDERGRAMPEYPITVQDAFNHYAVLYLRYIQVLRKLAPAYDQIVHPQKRRDILLSLESVMARICQIKAELVRFSVDGHQSDYLSVDQFLLDLQLSPDELEMPVPAYFKEAPLDEEEDNPNRDLLVKSLEEHGMTGGVEEDVPEPIVPFMTKEAAIRIIQKNERGRQGAVRAKLMRELQGEEIQRRKIAGSGGHAGRDPMRAAVLIQRVFRGHLSRLRTRKLAAEELVFIGMKPAPKPADGAVASKYDPVAKSAQIRRNRKIRQADNELKYVESLVELQGVVHDTEGPELTDKMWAERYEWWIAKKKATGKFPDSFAQFYVDRDAPPVDPEAEAAAAEEKKKNKGKKGKGKGKAAAAAKPKAKAGKRGKGKDQETEEERLTNAALVGPSQIVNHMMESVSKYEQVWSVLDESENHLQQHDVNLAKDKLRPLVVEKIQKDIDVRLLAYLDNIKAKIQASKKKKRKGKKGKGKGGKKKKKKGGKKKGGKGGKKKKKKKCCDGEKSCSSLSLADMVSVLVKMQIVQELKKPLRKISDLRGDMNVLGSAYQSAEVAVDPTFQQLRNVLTELFVLPLGSKYVKENSPLHNALLLYGPEGSGKSLASKAIAAEANATWFDLSPANLEGKLGSSKSEIAKLVHMVFRVATEMAPSVIYVDQIERMFLPSKSKKSASELVKVKHYIMQHKSGLTADKRVLVIGNTRAPFHPKIDRKDLQKFFGYQHYGKMLFMPCPNYGTRLKLWKYFIEKTGLGLHTLQRNPKFDLTTLAYISEGFSAGNIYQAVVTTLPPRKVQRVQEVGRLIDSAEFVAALSKTAYTYRDDYLAYQKFTDEVTGEKERRKLREQAAELEAEQAAEKKKKRR